MVTVAGGVATGGMIYYGPVAACPTFASALGVGTAASGTAGSAAATTAALLQRYQRELADAQRNLAYWVKQQELMEEAKMVSQPLNEIVARAQAQVDYLYYAIQNLRK